MTLAPEHLHPPPRLLTRPFLLAALAHAMLNIAAFLFVHLPGFLQQLGAGEAEIGRIMATQAAGAILAWPLVGRAMDRQGRRGVILAGVGLFAVVVALYLTVTSIGPWIYLVRLLDGIAATMWYTALFTYAADLVPPQRRTEGLAIFGTSGLIPLGLSAWLGDVILARATFQDLFVGALVAALAGLVLCVPLRDARAASPGGVPPRHALRTATQRDLVPLWLTGFTFFISVMALFTFMKTFVTTTGTGTVGGFFGAYAATAVLLRLTLGWLPDRIGGRRMLGLALGAYAAGAAVLALAGTPGAVFAAGVLCGAGHGYAFPVLFSLVLARARPQERGAAAAFFTAVDWTGHLVAGPLIGTTIERAGYTAAFGSLALMLTMGIAMFHALDRRPSA